MKGALGVAVLAAAACNAAAFLGEDTLRVRVVDAQTGKPMGGAFVVAREFTDVPQFHGSRTFCFRGDIARATAMPHVAALPSVGFGELGLTERQYRAVEAFAYLPGYCIDRTASAQHLAYLRRLPEPMRGELPANAAEFGGEVTLRARPFPQRREERLQYLLDFSTGLYCARPNWSERSRAAESVLAEAIVAEASSIARDRYEKSLVEQLRARLADVGRFAPAPNDAAMLAAVGVAPPRGYARDFIVAPASYRVAWPAEGSRGAGPDVIGIAVAPARARPQAVSPAQTQRGAAQPGNAAFATQSGRAPGAAPVAPSAEEKRIVIHCRHGPPSACDLDERDVHGMTALASFVGELKAEETRVLLEAGANPAAVIDTAGNAAVEVLVKRMIQRTPAAGSADVVQAREIIKLLAADPRTTLTQSLHDDLAADPATWMVQAPEAKALLMEAREAFAAVPARPEATPACERIEPPLGGAFPIVPALRPPRPR